MKPIWKELEHISLEHEKLITLGAMSKQVFEIPVEGSNDGIKTAPDAQTQVAYL